MPERTVVVSDIHLGAVAEENARAFLAFLDEADRWGDELLINGDLFDFWFEYGQVIPRGQLDVLVRLRRLVEGGVRILFMGGNHDAWGGVSSATRSGSKSSRSRRGDASEGGARISRTATDSAPRTGVTEFSAGPYAVRSDADSFGGFTPISGSPSPGSPAGPGGPRREGPGASRPGLRSWLGTRSRCWPLTRTWTSSCSDTRTGRRSPNSPRGDSISTPGTGSITTVSPS